MADYSVVDQSQSESPKLEHTEPFVTLPFREKLNIVKEIFINSISTISAFLIPSIANLISLYYLRQYGQDEIVGGYGLGVMFSTVFAAAWIYSFNQASNVFISRSFGAGDYAGCNRYFRRGLIILLVWLVLLSVGLFLAEDIMLLCGVDERLASNAGEFTRLSVFFIIGAGLFDSMKAFSMAQRQYAPILYIQVTTLALHFGWAYLFIDKLQMGIEGAVICRTIEEWSNTALIYIYIRASGKFTQTWGGWDRDIFNVQEIWEQFKFAFKIAIVSYISFIYFEIQTLMAGSFNARQVVVHIGIGTTASCLFMVTLGVSLAMLTMFGNSLGEGNLVKAKNYIFGGFTLIGILTIIFLILIFTLMTPWSTFWSTDPETQAALRSTVLAYIIGPMIVDGFNNGISAILKSVKKEKEAIMTVFYGLYVVSIPIMVVLAFVLNLQTLGIWIAFSIGEVVEFVLYLYHFTKIEWDKLTRKCV